MSERRGKIVLTRPKSQSLEFAAKLFERYNGQDTLEVDSKDNRPGFEEFLQRFFILSPVMRIDEREADIPSVENIEAVIVTSANAITPQIKNTPFKEIPFYVVGQSVAAKVLDAGFSNIRTIAPTIEHMIGDESVMEILRRKKVLYVRGQDVTTEIRPLFEQGHLTESITYSARAETEWSPELKEAVQEGSVEAVTFFSTRSARIFCDIAISYGLTKDLRRIKALCISTAVLEYVQPFFERNPCVSEFPDSAAMLNLVQDVLIKGYSNKDRAGF